MRFNRHEHSIDFRKMLGIVEAKNPAAIRLAVHVKDTEIRSVGFFSKLRISFSPNLEGAGVRAARLVIEIKGIKNQRLVLRIEHAAKRFTGTAAAIHVKDIGDIKLARSHQFANVAIGRQELLVVSQTALLIAVAGCKFLDLRFQRCRPQESAIVLSVKTAEFSLSFLAYLLHVAKLAGQFISLVREKARLLFALA